MSRRIHPAMACLSVLLASVLRTDAKPSKGADSNLLYEAAALASSSVSNSAALEVASPVSQSKISLPLPDSRTEGGVVHSERTTVQYSDGSARTIAEKTSFVELASGLNAKIAGVWQPSALSPSSDGKGNVSFSGLSKLFRFAADANTENVVDIGDGTNATRSAVAGLSYVDRASGLSHVFAHPASSGAELVSDGVVYVNAFEGADADIRYRLDRAKVQQDIVIYGLPDPAAFGLNPATTWLVVLTELLDVDIGVQAINREGAIGAGEPNVAALKISSGHAEQYNFQRCFAYAEEGELSIGGSERQKHLVEMRVFEAEGRTFLSEEVPFATVIQEAPNLVMKGTAPDDKLVKIPPRRGENADVARTTPRRKSQTAFVMDYINYYSALNEVTFKQGVTYYISAEVAITNRLTIEAGAFVKFAPTGQVTLMSGAQIVNKSHLANPALFTTAYDSNGGETVSSGNPTNNKVNCFIQMNELSNNLSGIRFRYGKQAVKLQGGPSQLRDLEFVDCDIAVQGQTGTVSIINALFRQGSNGVVAVTNSITIRAATFDKLTGSAITTSNGVTSLVVKDSAFTSVTNIYTTPTNTAYKLQTNAIYLSGGWQGSNVIALSFNPYQSGIYGSFYLNPTSGVVNAGSATGVLYHYTTGTNGLKETNSTLDVGFHNPTTNDLDSDGLFDFQEDWNGDGLYDSTNDISSWTTNDTDGDLLTDGVEYTNYLTNPKLADTDGDAISDGAEVSAGSDPLNILSFPATISGATTYSGNQTGIVRIVATSYAMPTQYSALHMSFDSNTTTVADNSAFRTVGELNGATWASNGVTGGCYVFDGDDYIAAGDFAQVEGQYNLSWGAWVNASNGMSLGGIMGNTEYENDSTYLVLNSGGTGGDATIKTADDVEQRYARANGLVTNGVWQHVFATYNGTQVVLHLNGQAVDSASYATNKPIRANSATAAIGDISVGVGWFMKGRIDEARIFRGTLTSNEIKGLYQDGMGFGIRRTTNTASVGGYTLASVPTLSNYWLTAWIDANGDGKRDYWEPVGNFAGNPLALSNAASGISIPLTDPDSDGDGAADILELQLGTDPASTSSFPTTISGTISYGGYQPGPIRVVATYEPGLALHYDFSANHTSVVYDVSGQNRTATNRGAVYTTNGYRGGAYVFADTNDCIYAGDVLDVTAQVTNLTASCWVRITGAGGDEHNILGKNVDQYPATGWALKTPSDGKAFIDYIGYYPERAWFESTNNLVDTNWHFLVGTFERGGSSLRSTLYVDGIAKGTGTYSGSLTSTDTWSPLTLGGRNHTGIWGMKGTMDEVKIYDRLLTPAEIATLMASGISSAVSVTTTLATAGAYVFSNMPNGRAYSISAYVDANTNNAPDSTEANASYSNNPLVLLSAATNVDVVLVDPDNDHDGLPDWWEVLHGLDPTAGTTNGLVAWYRLEETSGTVADDSSIQANDGSITGTTAAAWQAGRIGKSLTFDGTNDGIRVSHAESLSLRSNITIMAWVNQRAQSSSRQAIVQKTLSYYFSVANGNPDFYFYGLSTPGYHIATNVLPTNAWTHVTASYDASKVRIFVGGSNTYSLSVAGLGDTNANPVGVGYSGAGSRYLDGSIDDVRIYSTALSTNEIRGIREHGLDPDGDGLSNYDEYRMGTDPLLPDVTTPAVVLDEPASDSVKVVLP